MRSYATLPSTYYEVYSIDLQKNKKVALFINVLAVLITVVMIVPASFFVSILNLFSMESGITNFLIRMLALALLSIAYIILHELVHGVAMKICGTKKVKYGFTGLYAYAGSNDFYSKGAYIFIALAPVVLLGAVLLVVNFFVSAEWFWVVYFIQIINLSGASGDYFVTIKFLTLPKDVLIADYGVGMKVYFKK